MLNLLTKFSLFVFIAGVAYAGVMPDPPTTDNAKETQRYLKTIHDNMNNLTVVTSAPNGSRNGRKGDMVLYNNTGTYEFWVNTDNAKTWQKI